MRKILVFIFSVVFISHSTKCSSEVKIKAEESINNKFLHELVEDEEYNNYNFFYKFFGRKGIIMKLIYHGKDLEYREALAGHYVKYNENKEKTKIEYIELAKKMVDRKYKKEDINDVLDKIMKS